MILMSLVVVFFLCHLPRNIVNLYEFAIVETQILCHSLGPFSIPFWCMILLKIGEILIIVNSSANFFIYYMVGDKFRKELKRFCGYQVSKRFSK